MAKIEKEQILSSQAEAFELIELAADDIDTLTRAFEVIEKACAELSNPYLSLVELPPKVVIN